MGHASQRGRSHMSRGSLIALVGCIVAAVVVVGLALGGDRGDGHALPEGGSSFRDASAAHPKPGTGLIDALAGVLGDGPPATTGTQAAPAPRTTTTAAATALPASGARAAARLFLIGFGGTRPSG